MDEVSQSPFVEQLVAKGFEVIYFTDPLDEYVMQVREAVPWRYHGSTHAV